MSSDGGPLCSGLMRIRALPQSTVVTELTTEGTMRRRLDS